MAYTFRYELLRAPAARVDGSGCLSHDIEAYYSEDDGATWVVVGGRHKDIIVPGSEMQTILAMPDSTGPQRQAKNVAYKSALVANLDTQPVGVTGWPDAQMAAYLDGNKLSAEVATGANDYITITLSQSYPVPFSI